MRVVDAIAEMLKREGVELVFGYPVNPLFDAVAKVDIRTVVVRTERTGIHMADAYSRMSSGKKIGVFTMQSGPGTENSFGAIQQAYSECVPLVVIGGGYERRLTNVRPNFNPVLNFQHVTKWAEQITTPDMLGDAVRRAFTQARNGRPGPAYIEVPADMWGAEVAEPIAYTPSIVVKSGPDMRDVDTVAQTLIDADRPLIYAGQGIHYAEAWPELRELVELLEAPICTSLEGKSSFPEGHPLSLGSGGRAMPGQVWNHVQEADVVFGAGVSFGSTHFGITFPKNGKTYIQATNDTFDLSKDVAVQHALIGDAKLSLQALNVAVRERLNGQPRGRKEEAVSRIKTQRDEWMQTWGPKLASNETPLSPYRVVSELMRNVDQANAVITHDAGSPRDQLSPFWQSTEPLGYIGWGKTTQLGYGLGLAMGAKLAKPEKVCINMWGDAAIGMTGMDFETAVRERIPILSVLLNNYSMAIELPVMPVSTEKYRATDISGNYAEFAQALGGYGERVTDPAEVGPAIKRAIEKTREGQPVLLEFITQKSYEYSQFH